MPRSFSAGNRPAATSSSSSTWSFWDCANASGSPSTTSRIARAWPSVICPPQPPRAPSAGPPAWTLEHLVTYLSYRLLPRRCQHRLQRRVRRPQRRIPLLRHGHQHAHRAIHLPLQRQHRLKHLKDLPIRNTRRPHTRTHRIDVTYRMLHGMRQRGLRNDYGGGHVPTVTEYLYEYNSYVLSAEGFFGLCRLGTQLRPADTTRTAVRRECSRR